MMSRVGYDHGHSIGKTGGRENSAVVRAVIASIVGYLLYR